MELGTAAKTRYTSYKIQLSLWQQMKVQLQIGGDPFFCDAMASGMKNLIDR